MRRYFCILLLLLIFEIKHVLNIVRTSNYSSLNLSSTNVTILHVKLVNSAQTAYVSMRDTDGYPKIKAYSLSSGSPFSLQKTYAEPTRTVYPDNIMLFVYNNDPMVIGIESTNMNFSVCYMVSTYCLPNTYTVNETVAGYL